MNSPACPTCSLPLPADAPGSICPACLLKHTFEAATPPQPPDEEGRQLSAAFPHLVIEEMLGQGGMGRVYRAQQPHLSRTVALKVLSAERVNDPEWLERFSREARALARLSHPHIVQVYDFGEKPVPHLLMEHIEGVNLRQAMQNGGLTTREALAIVPKLCDALQYAHEHGVLHRDIKPENILIDTEGRVKIVDFGLAKLRDEGVLPFTLTQSGARLGTLAYMAPEQVEKPAEVDHRADIYSLGVVLYEMLTGGLPLGRFPTPSEASGVDPRLDGVVMRTLEKMPDRRFQNAGEVRSSIEQAGGAPAVKAAPLPFWEYRSRLQFGSWPLLHIAMGRDPATGRMARARGIIAMGQVASGGLAIGVFAHGIVSWGVFSIGLLAFGVGCAGLVSSGVLALALVASQGVIAIAPYALGVTAAGWTAAGVKAFGIHTASYTGSISPQAAAFGDRWMLPTEQWGQFINATMGTVMMTLGAVVAWKTRQPKWQVLLSILLMPLCWTGLIGAQGHSRTFTQQLAQMEKQAEAHSIRNRSDAWTARAAEAGSLEGQQKVMREILEALGSDDAVTLRAALYTVSKLRLVEFDHEPFRMQALRHLGSSSPKTRIAAISALVACKLRPEDRIWVDRLAAECTDEEIKSVLAAYHAVFNGDFRGVNSAPVLALLERGMTAVQKDRTHDALDQRSIIGVLWGAQVSPEIEARLIEWSYLDHDGQGGMVVGGSRLGYNSFYHGLSVVRNKSRAGVRRLIELAYHPDVSNVAGRCLWGLNGTVPDPADRAFLAAEVIKLLGLRNAEYLWKGGLTLLRSCATLDHLPALEALSKRETLPADRREGLAQVMLRIKGPQ